MCPMWSPVRLKIFLIIFSVNNFASSELSKSNSKLSFVTIEHTLLGSSNSETCYLSNFKFDVLVCDFMVFFVGYCCQAIFI